MKEVSRQSTPQDMVRLYGDRLPGIGPRDRLISLSRRGLSPPRYLIARSSIWKEEIDPWQDRSRLPVLEGGLLGELSYCEEPRVIDDLDVPPGDPGAEHLEGARSLVALPVFDEGRALNVVVFLSDQKAGFDREKIPDMVWQVNLFGRATHNLALSRELQLVNHMLDQELMSIAEIQRSLLPSELPDIPTLDLAADYRTSRRAGGDYYDVFPLDDGKWGLLIADVSGHGAPAAVLMAITHSLAHSFAGLSNPPGRRLEHINHHLCERYTAESGSFVTAFYAVYDPSQRSMSYSRAGHNPPLLIRRGAEGAELLEGTGRPPLGVCDGQKYPDCYLELGPGDRLVLYTDGITEACSPSGEQFGVARIEGALARATSRPEEIVDSILNEVARFTAGGSLADDRTLLVASARVPS
jgi:sigma-B regulation protein RsbU (phosphoserine phosphatase)